MSLFNGSLRASGHDRKNWLKKGTNGKQQKLVPKAYKYLWSNRYGVCSFPTELTIKPMQRKLSWHNLSITGVKMHPSVLLDENTANISVKVRKTTSCWESETCSWITHAKSPISSNSSGINRTNYLAHWRKLCSAVDLGRWWSSVRGYGETALVRSHWRSLGWRGASTAIHTEIPLACPGETRWVPDTHTSWGPHMNILQEPERPCISGKCSLWKMLWFNVGLHSGINMRSQLMLTLNISYNLSTRV